MALVDKKIKDFDVTAFKAGEEDFFQVTRDDIKGKWSVFFFYPADFTFFSRKAGTSSSLSKTSSFWPLG